MSKKTLVLIAIILIIIVGIVAVIFRKNVQAPSEIKKEEAQKEEALDASSIENLNKNLSEEAEGLDADISDLESFIKDSSLDSLEEDLSNISF